MQKKRVLFLCQHNSGRSQMAEALLKAMGGGGFEVESAGLEPMPLNPFAVKAMAEIGIDISRNLAKPVFLFIRSSRRFDWVITVCDEAAAERCPVFPGFTRKLHWSLPDPAGFSGDDERRLDLTRTLRDQIREKIGRWLQELGLPSTP